MIKVFISHQRADSAKAEEIAMRLRDYHQIGSYLDVIDSKLGYNGEDLAEYIRTQMGTCNQLLAVVSQATRASQWVPWEIGVATEKDFPLATFAGAYATVPEFIANWPVLRDMPAIDAYAHASKQAERTYSTRKSAFVAEAAARQYSTKSFYSDLRSRL